MNLDLNLVKIGHIDLSTVPTSTVRLLKVLNEVLSERQAQNAKWGEQNHEPSDWLMILGEEVGEVNKAALEFKFKYKNENGASLNNYRLELIQVAAVAVAMVECLDRAKAKEGEKHVRSKSKPRSKNKKARTNRGSAKRG